MERQSWGSRIIPKNRQKDHQKWAKTPGGQSGCLTPCTENHWLSSSLTGLFWIPRWCINLFSFKVLSNLGLCFIRKKKSLCVRYIQQCLPFFRLAQVWEESSSSGELKTPVKLVHPYSVQYFGYNFQQREVKFPKSHRKPYSPVNIYP